MTATPTKVTFGEMRAPGVRDVLIIVAIIAAAIMWKAQFDQLRL
jgi:hypothetical protein